MASFDSLISRNKRNTFLLCILVTVVMCLMAAAIALVVVGYQTAEPELYGQAVEPAPPLSYTLSISIGAALVVAAIMIVFAYFGGASAILAVSRARQIRKSDDPQLFNVIEEMTIAANMPMPRIFVINDTAMNAFATGRDPQHAAVAITLGLRDKLTRDELQAVMAHEMSHIRNFDIRLALFVAVLVGLIVLMADFFLRYLWWGGASRRRSRGKGGGGIQLVIMVVAILLAILAPLFAKLIQLAVSRQREYLADATAAEMTRQPEALASALAKLEADTEVLEVANRGTAHLYIVNPFKPHERRFKVSGLFRTHPEVADRIRRLMSLGRGGQQ